MASSDKPQQNSSQDASGASGASGGEEKKKLEPSDYEDYGYAFYPERRREQQKPLLSRVFEGRGAKLKTQCEMNVAWCMEHNAMVRLLMRALKSHGCPVELGRHVACEPCTRKISGGFDPDLNQIVICQNNLVRRTTCCSIMAHELTHMFDYCRADIDFNNLEHLACTEVRAANFMHCSLAGSVVDGDSTPWNFGKQHRNCVYRKALNSVLLVRNVTPQEAKTAVDSVFYRCYRDLEPIGRIPRRASKDPERALNEGLLYGYTD